ncbi:extracellular solute-binding protein [Paenibacillus silvae]|uniref:extracellular solute-binding protein n=1 Tax=Paenibacillus silvae TaxID=1325358 RepID=UPI0011AAF211|nr:MULTISPECIES: extracellular solute-binding protein [Paenibacillus]MCK6073328.1 extracellular solute-binding protein [Paenibacillus silvae]MCK6149196.1 extracellular solute-binding protein [Paenibacillus silvae]MCK6267495.1 extracellular solute-binding protein [Paenibacillus silvae]
MRKNKPLLSLLTVVGLSMSLLAGCGSASDAKSTASESGTGASSSTPASFNFYFTGSQNVKDLWDSLEPMFEKEHPDIDVKMVYIPSGTGAEPTYDRIVAAKKAGKGSGDIDLYEDGIVSVSQGIKDGVWAQLDAKDIPNLSKVSASTMKDVNNYAVPYRSSAVVLAYNSSKVSSPPKTLDELLTWIKANPGQFAYNDPSTGGSGSSFVQTIVYKDLPEEDIHNADPAVMDKWSTGFNTLKELGPYVYGKGIYPKKNQGTLDLLMNGEVSIIPAWSDMVLQQLNEGLLPDTIKMQQITPGFNGGPTYLMVNQASDKKEAVNTFLNFVLSPEAQEVIVNKMNGFPGIELSNMPQEVQSKFDGVAEGFRTFNIGDLGTEINKRWQSDVAAQ